MLIVLIAKKGFGFKFWIRFNYSRIVYYSELPTPTCKQLADFILDYLNETWRNKEMENAIKCIPL